MGGAACRHELGRSGILLAAPEMPALFGGERPIGWEDGSGRVL